MKKQIIYQGKGISKRYTLSMIFLFIALEALGVFFLIQKRYSHVLEKGNNTFSEEGSVYVGQISLKSSYALSSGPRLAMAIIFILFGILIMGIIISLKRTKITLYNEFIEFSDCTNNILLGLTSSKYMKDVRVPYSSIISVKADSAHCQIYISLVEGKQYRVVCKDAKQVSEMLETKCGKLC